MVSSVGRDLLLSHTKLYLGTNVLATHLPPWVPLLSWSPWYLCPRIKQLCHQWVWLMGVCRVFEPYPCWTTSARQATLLPVSP